MFDGKRINSLEQSVGTLTEELTRANETITSLNNTIESLFENIEEIVSELNKVKFKDDELAKKYDDFKKTFDGLADKSNNTDAEHSAQIKTLCDNNDRLIAKCEELQLSNVQIMNEHRDMIRRYEEDIKAYQTQTQNMKDNILKKMNANNIISVVEE